MSARVRRIFPAFDIERSGTRAEEKLLDAETLAKIKEDDVELMLFSFKYLANTLFGAPGLTIRQEKVKAKVEEIKKRQDEALQQAEKEYEELKAERDRMEQEKAAKKKAAKKKPAKAKKASKKKVEKKKPAKKKKK